MLKKPMKTAALFVITVMVMGGLLGAAFGQVQGAEKVTFSFAVQGNGISPASNVEVELENANGVVLASSMSNPNVVFSVYPGNYIVYVPSQYVQSGSIVYSASHLDVSVRDNGTAYVGNSVLKNISVTDTAATSYVYVSVKGISYSQVTSVYLVLPNGLEMPASKVNASNPNSGYSVTTVTGPQTLSIQYNSTSKAVYSEQITVSDKSNNSIVANVSSLDNVLGTVSSTTGKYINRVEVSIYQSGVLLGSDEFENGYYYLTLAPGTYSLVISSPGYLPQVRSVTTGTSPSYNSTALTPSNVVGTQTITFGSNFQNVTVSGGITLTNGTVLPFLPNSNAGSLYNQLNLDGVTSAELWAILNVTVPYNTANTVLFNNYSYNSTGSTTQFTVGPGYTFSFSYSATYYQSKVVPKSDSSIRVYVNENGNNTTATTYVTELSIPAPYQRSNIISSSTATVTGYSGTIKITNSTFNGFLTINIAPQAKPLLRMGLISTTWSGYFESTISSNTSSNFTLVVPVGKTVTLNASNVPYDTVLGTDNYQEMNFSWMIGATPMYGYNITDTFSSGSYSVSLKVVSSSGVANETNFTIIGDSLNPQFNLKVIQNGGARLNVTTTSSASYTLWVNQTETVYFNSIGSKDLLPSGQSTGIPISVSWNINGTSETGTNVSFTFSHPTFGSTVDYAYATVMNGVGNSFTVNLSIHVNDTTPPIATITITNATSHAVISSIKQGQNVTINGSKSFAPDGGHIVSYTWTFTFSNGTVAKPNVDYKIYSTSSNNSTITLSFIQSGVFDIKLNVTDQSNNHGSNSQSLSVIATGPEVEIMNVTYPSSYVEGSSSVLKIGLKNVGLTTATTYYVTVKIGGKLVKNETFTDLSSNQSTNVSMTIVPPASGSYSMNITVHAVGQPTFFNTGVTDIKAITVSQAAWKLPALVGGIVVAIGVLSFIYYDVTVRRKRPKEVKPPKKQLKV